MTTTLPPIISSVSSIGLDSNGRAIKPHPEFLRWAQFNLTKRVGGDVALSNLELADQNTLVLGYVAAASPGLYNVNLSSDIAALTWAPLGRPVPKAIQTGGHHVVGKGAATYYLTGSGPANAYRFQDADGNWWALDTKSPVYPEQLGAEADGVTDDSAAFTAALAAFQKILLRPGANYVVGDLILSNGVMIDGSTGLDYTTIDSYIFPRLTRKAGCASVLNAGSCRAGVLIGFTIDGVDNTCNGISAGGSHLFLDRLYIVNCTYGWGGTPAGGSTFSRSCQARNVEIVDCSIAGIGNIIDSAIIECVLASNAIGIKCISGSNTNRVLGGRIEWNTNENIRLDGSGGANVSDWVITGVQLDRGGTCGVYGNHASRIQISNCMHRRAGATNSGGVGTRSHLFFDNSQIIAINNPLATHGTDDGGGGNDTPPFFVECNNVVTNLTITGGDVSLGYTSAPMHYNSGLNTTQMPGHKIIGVNGIDDFDNVSLLQRGAGRTGVGIQPSAAIPCLGTSGVLAVSGGNQAFAIGPLDPIGTFDERKYTLTVWTRDAFAPAARQQATFAVFIRQEGTGTIVIETDPASSQTSAGAIAFSGATNIGLAFSGLAADGSSVTLTATNNNATHSIRVWVQMQPF